MTQDSLDDEIFLEALDALGPGEKDLGHAARGETGDEFVLTKGHWLE